MKKTAPVVLGMLVGSYAIVAYFVPHYWLQQEVTSRVLEWAGMIAAAAFVLGAINLVAVTWPKIRRREPDWQYKCVLLGAAAVMVLVGLPWGMLGEDRPAGAVEKIGADPAAAARGTAVFELAAPADVEVTLGVIGADEPGRGGRMIVTNAGRTPRVEVPAGQVTVKSRRRVAGYDAFATAVTAAPGDVLRLTSDPQMRWGAEGRARTWIFDHVFAPCNATMFALLAFFVASAAFRAFRARNVEAGLLLGAAIVVLLARAPIGAQLSDWLPDLAQWILDVPSNGSRRAIMMGAAVAAIATSLRVILGLERSHLGGE